MQIIEQIIHNLGAFLSAHTTLAYLVLFLGSYFETLIGTGFFLYGELIFLPGAILAGAGILNIWMVMFVLVLGGVLGDSSSFFIGKKYGLRMFKEDNKFFSLTNYKRGEDFFNKYGMKSVFFARLLGPLSWITPFLAGACNNKYRSFIKYNVPGVTVGIGEFVLVGYFFGSSYKQVLLFVQERLAIVMFSGFLLLIIYYAIKRNDPDFFGKVGQRLKRNSAS